jgi:hypothetical protein
VVLVLMLMLVLVLVLVLLAWQPLQSRGACASPPRWQQ